MQPYVAFLVPGGLAAFIAVVGLIFLLLERHAAAARRKTDAEKQTAFQYARQRHA